jgi:hypothetical protein
MEPPKLKGAEQEARRKDAPTQRTKLLVCQTTSQRCRILPMLSVSRNAFQADHHASCLDPGLRNHKGSKGVSEAAGPLERDDSAFPMIRSRRVRGVLQALYGSTTPRCTTTHFSSSGRAGRRMSSDVMLRWLKSKNTSSGSALQRLGVPRGA